MNPLLFELLVFMQESFDQVRRYSANPSPSQRAIYDMNILLLRITLTVTLLCTFTATLIIRLLAIEEMDIWGLSINGVIMMGSISLLFCLWSEDISSWTMLMRTGGILSILEIFLLGVFIAACASEKPYQMEEYLVFSILSLLPIRVVYFILVIAGKKAMEMDGE